MYKDNLTREDRLNLIEKRNDQINMVVGLGGWAVLILFLVFK